MKLIVVTTPTFFVEEDKIITALFEEGLDILHLRKPETPAMYSERLLTLIPEKYHKRIVTHEHFYLKEEYRLNGIHIDTPTLTPPLNYKGHISRTCTKLELLKEMKKQSNYVFLRNIFDSQSEPEQKSYFTMNDLEKAADNGLIDKKVYALGGMNTDNLQIARDLGFGGVVICGDLWNRFDIHNQNDYKELINHFERLRKIIS